MITDFHAKYLAHALTKRCAPDSSERLAGAVAGAQVDLNPHQVDAALFAFASPLSKGALLADEVGLGKTIEAGLVIAQRWAERKRRILVIAPSNLRKQWHQELSEKFLLPAVILESKSYNQSLRDGSLQPFEVENAIVICSYQFARTKVSDVQRVPWDLVVIDEAHRLRNVYKPSNVIANTLKNALARKNKLLLTATPLQNSLLELYGLVSFIDEHAFGDVKSFREQFANPGDKRNFEALKERLKPICHRTLRRQVTAYIPYTRRLPLIEEFTPAAGEDRLYQLVSDYLQRDDLQALPSGQRSLMTLVLRKLLASSTFAIAGALNSISHRLKAKLAAHPVATSLEDELSEDFEALDATADEWPADADEEALTGADRAAIAAEIADLESFAKLATSIEHNAKGTALLKVLHLAFAKARQLGGAEKAIIFTESRKTQEYLQRILSESPYAKGVVLFNGTNTDPPSRAIYARWIERHAGSDRVTGSRTADMRSALVDFFRDEGQIMIATEAGAEGINLQFCSLVVNYDLPWNPQRVEQRIGRCHRYGQKHDVVVVNFINRKNEADQRVHRLLSEKFRLFEGVFGASDEVLGAIESGVDFEKRIAAIYQECRRPEQIRAAFDRLQSELSLEIDTAMSRTRQKLLEEFDDEVREKLRVRDEDAKVHLDRHEQRLMRLTRHELDGQATFHDGSSFTLRARPPWANGAAIPSGLYELPRRSGEAHTYRLGHPLGEAVVARAKARPLAPAEVHFDYAGHAGRISILEPFIGRAGWLAASLMTVEALDEAEDHILLAGIADDGEPLGGEVCDRLLTIEAARGGDVAPEAGIVMRLDRLLSESGALIRGGVSKRNARFFEAEADKLDGWADDLKVGLEREIREIDRLVKEARRAAASAVALEDKLAGQKRIKTLEATRNQKRRSLFDAQDRIDAQRAALIAQIEARLEQKVAVAPLFILRWRLA
ncbi:SNF2-related protein [Prosthecomicrobium pneumaticum]|uniref:Adenine-specific DNA-methyltransferase n=1 Tax=Prosthecomicrobium pneumaticum TaxID=81895 RepID=A0A7W9L3I7_9HYPH|nr:SNF2-related protein [Prosthecomicrobium pneumaticum]MBB5754580.1 adenine-specific DNA-methyltransferase [Prosthecomicrobium pneumaticum]